MAAPHPTKGGGKAPPDSIDFHGQPANLQVRRNLLWLLAGLLCIDGALYGLYALQALLADVFPFYYNPLEGYAGFLYDFYNPMLYTYHLNPMAHLWSNSPPFLHLLCFLLTLPLRLFTQAEGGAAVSWSLPGQVLFLLLAGGMLLALGRGLWQAIRPFLRPVEGVLLGVALFASYPFFFALACGNLVLLVAALCGLFMVAYQRKRYGWAALCLGLAAALKLYPALLGLLFLKDKRWREALLCASVGLGLTALSLALFQGGFLANLQDFLQKTSDYNQYGNQNLRRILMDSNSLKMLWDIPYYISKGAAVTLEEMAAHNLPATGVLTALLALSCLACFALPTHQDRVLLLSLWMVGYPYNSGPYNLVLVALPLVWWVCSQPKGALPMVVLGVLLMMCKTRFALYATTVRHITLQALLNPLLLAAMMGWLLYLRREALGAAVRKAASFLAYRALQRGKKAASHREA